ncbi:MAG: UDP-2,3-diacylglucosamine diphosphatase [Bacteroidales bacterium]|jgi:UDP-2,3-diacylglucosamine pyrophosphatase LpxH|nr:UDP-2,3-diacylglucosamine diphosphatase [Bacteroidales bacterium]
MDRIAFKSIVISDVHLGSPHSKLVEVTKFLSMVNCERLIMAGDIIDGWQLKSEEDKWTLEESMFFQVIMKMMEKMGTEVIYVTGNHDDFLFPIVPCELFKIKIVSEYIIEDFGKRFVVIHGHAFDAVTMHFRWLSKLGAIGYNFLLRFNQVWNKSRERSGKGKFSLSKYIKYGVKKAVNIISGFESDLDSFARSLKCSGVICGHIHHPEDKILKHGTHYLNSGDWVESMTALGEDFDGNWRVLRYKDMVNIQ